MINQLRSLPRILSTFAALFALTLIAQSSPAQQVLKGHSIWVYTVAYSPNGQTIVSGSADETIWIWDANTGEHLQTLQGHADSVLSVAFSPDGQTIASASADNTIRLWDANMRTLQGHTGPVSSVAYSPDGQTIASASYDHTVRIWDANTGAHLRTLKGHTNRIMSVAYSPDGQTIASAGEDSMIRLWDASTGAHLRTLQGHAGSIWSVAYSPDGQTIASGGGLIYGTIRIWDANTGAHLQTLQGHAGSIWSVAYSPDGQTIASGGGDHTIRIWNAATGAHLQTFQGHTDQVWSVAYSPDGQKIVSGSNDNTIRIWDFILPNVIVSGPIGSQTGAFDVTIAFDFAVTGFELSDIVVTNGSATNLAGSGAAYTAAIEPTNDGKLTVSIPAGAAQDKNGKGNDASNTYETTINRHVLKGYEHIAISVAYSPDGQAIVSGGGYMVRVWNAKTGTHLRTLQGHTDMVGTRGVFS